MEFSPDARAMKPISEMTLDESATAGAMIAKMVADRPAGQEVEIFPTFTPGVIFFQDGQYRAVSPDIATVWPEIEFYISSILLLLPLKHHLKYWRERIERGATIALAFVDSSDTSVRGAGILNCEVADDGELSVIVAVHTLHEIDLSHVATIAEVAALALDAEAVHLWTPIPVPIVPGYQVVCSGEIARMARRPLEAVPTSRKDTGAARCRTIGKTMRLSDLASAELAQARH